MSCIIEAYIVAAAHLYYVCGLGISLLYALIALLQAQSIVIEPYIIYKTISFLDKKFLYFQYKYANNKRAIFMSSISLVSLQRPLYPFIVFIIYLVYIFLLELLDLGNYKSQYKAFYLFYYLLYSCCVIRLAALFYPKAYRNRQYFNQVIFIKHFYAKPLEDLIKGLLEKRIRVTRLAEPFYQLYQFVIANSHSPIVLDTKHI